MSDSTNLQIDIVIDPSQVKEQLAQVERSLSDIISKVASSGRNLGEPIAESLKKVAATTKVVKEEGDKLNLTLAAQEKAYLALKEAISQDEELAKNSAVQRRVFNSLLASGNSEVDKGVVIRAKSVEQLKQEIAVTTKLLTLQEGLTQSEKDSIRASQAKSAARKQFVDEEIKSANRLDYLLNNLGVRSPDQNARGINQVKEAMRLLNEQGIHSGVVFDQLTTKLHLFETGNARGRGELHKLTASLASLAFEATGAIYGLTMLGGAIFAPVIAGTKFMKTIEDAKFGMTGIFMSMGQVNGSALSFTQAMSASSAYVKEMQADSLRLGISLDKLVEVNRASLGGGLGRRNLKPEEVRQIASTGAVATQMLGLQSNQYVQEVRDILQGGIQAASSTLATSLGLTDKILNEWAKKGSDVYLKNIMDRFSGFASAAEEFQRTTFSGAWNRLTMSLQMAFTSETGFAGIINVLNRVSDYLFTINKQTNQLTINPAFLEQINSIWNFATSLLDILSSVAKAVIWALPALTKLAELYVAIWAVEKAQIWYASVTRILAGFTAASVASAATSSAAGVAAVETVGAAVTGMATRITALLGKGGLIGLALFAAYEAADYFGLIDKIFTTAENRLEKFKQSAKGKSDKDLMTSVVEEYTKLKILEDAQATRIAASKASEQAGKGKLPIGSLSQGVEIANQRALYESALAEAQSRDEGRKLLENISSRTGQDKTLTTTEKNRIYQASMAEQERYRTVEETKNKRAIQDIDQLFASKQISELEYISQHSKAQELLIEIDKKYYAKEIALAKAHGDNKKVQELIAASDKISITGTAHDKVIESITKEIQAFDKLSKKQPDQKDTIQAQVDAHKELLNALNAEIELRAKIASAPTAAALNRAVDTSSLLPTNAYASTGAISTTARSVESLTAEKDKRFTNLTDAQLKEQSDLIIKAGQTGASAIAQIAANEMENKFKGVFDNLIDPATNVFNKIAGNFGSAIVGTVNKAISDNLFESFGKDFSKQFDISLKNVGVKLKNLFTGSDEKTKEGGLGIGGTAMVAFTAVSMISRMLATAPSAMDIRNNTAAGWQKYQGTGTVVGDYMAQSQSLKLSLDQIAQHTFAANDYSLQMVKSLRAVQQSMSDFIALAAKSMGGDIATKMGFSQLVPTIIDAAKTGVQASLRAATAGGAIGGAIGGYFGGPAGAQTGAIIGSTIATVLQSVPVIKKITDWTLGGAQTTTVADAGYMINAKSLAELRAGKGISAYTTTQTVESGAFGGMLTPDKTSFNTYKQAVNAQVAQTFAAIFDPLAIAFETAGKQFGISSTNVTTALDTNIVLLDKLSLNGMTAAQQTDALNTFISKYSDAVAKQLVPNIDNLTVAGEGAAQALFRLMADVANLNSFAKAINDVSVATIDSASKLSKLVGGSALLNTALTDFFNSFATVGQKSTNATGAMDALMASIGQGGLTTSIKSAVDVTNLYKASTDEVRAVLLTNQSVITGYLKAIADSIQVMFKQLSVSAASFSNSSSYLIGNLQSVASSARNAAMSVYQNFMTLSDPNFVQRQRRGALANLSAMYADYTTTGVAPNAAAVQQNITQLGNAGDTTGFTSYEQWKRAQLQTVNILGGMGTLADTQLTIQQKMASTLDNILKAIQDQATAVAANDLVAATAAADRLMTLRASLAAIQTVDTSITTGVATGTANINFLNNTVSTSSTANGVSTLNAVNAMEASLRTVSVTNTGLVTAAVNTANGSIVTLDGSVNAGAATSGALLQNVVDGTATLTTATTNISSPTGDLVTSLTGTNGVVGALTTGANVSVAAATMAMSSAFTVYSTKMDSLLAVLMTSAQATAASNRASSAQQAIATALKQALPTATFNAANVAVGAPDAVTGQYTATYNTGATGNLSATFNAQNQLVGTGLNTSVAAVQTSAATHAAYLAGVQAAQASVASAQASWPVPPIYAHWTTGAGTSRLNHSYPLNSTNEAYVRKVLATGPTNALTLAQDNAIIAAFRAPVAQHDATLAQAQAALANAQAMPQYASGGTHLGGYRIVGEQGPEIEYTGPSTITSNANARSLFNVEGMINEIRILREELRAANVVLAQNTRDTAQMMKRWNGEGLPETRIA